MPRVLTYYDVFAEAKSASRECLMYTVMQLSRIDIPIAHRYLHDSFVLLTHIVETSPSFNNLVAI
jgi:hypothetical protein